ncbi:hypothetical protein EJB05_51224, partial [Eragrostis curvula]
MAGVVVSVSKGVMDSVLAKLNELVGDTCANLIGLSKDILFLRNELPAINALLKKLEDNEQLDLQVKNWRNQVLEMAYDIEDCIDSFMTNVQSTDARASFISQISNFVMTLRGRFDTAMQIKELKTRLQDINDRRKRYKVDDYCTSGTTMEALDPRLPALYNEAASLVGIDNPKEELIKWVLDEDQRLKVVSIVGRGGLGKTTLATKVYRKVKERFSNKAFVSVSRTPDVTRILTDMLSQLHQDQRPCINDVQYLINSLINYLHDKRYLIVVDDLWDVPPWNTIRCSFPSNNQQSREPGRQVEQWECIRNSLTIQFATDPALEQMVQILDLSYKSLPHHLKSCFLYLGKYPEDHKIGRDDLVRQWVAEGFVTTSPGRDVWGIAEGYLNGLVNRSMIQPIYEASNTAVSHYRVHDMMLDLILRRCGEDNFLVAVRDPQEAEKTEYKVRRLSMDIRGKRRVEMTVATTDLLSQVRSLTMFGGYEGIPPLLEFKFLRVLFLDFHNHYESMDLTWIILLSQLRYLKIAGGPGYDKNINLPSQIQGLQHLETFELAEMTGCRIIPSDIVIDLPRLSHLVVPWDTRLPDGIVKANSLRTLVGFSLVKSSSENIEALGTLTNLVDMKLTCREWTSLEHTQTATSALSSALEKLGNLKRISVLTFRGYRGDALSSLSPPFHNLERLDICRVVFPRVPKWIGGLRCLRELGLGVDEISNSSWRDVGIIGSLPCLIFLRLRILGVPSERIVISHATGFTVLRGFDFDCNGISHLTFEAGAMPSLRSLHLHFNPRRWDRSTPAGLKHLSSLKEIYAWRTGSLPPKEKATEVLIRSVFQEAADALPTRPKFTLWERWIPY